MTYNVSSGTLSLYTTTTTCCYKTGRFFTFINNSCPIVSYIPEKLHSAGFNISSFAIADSQQSYIFVRQHQTAAGNH